MPTFHDRLRERITALGKSLRAASIDSGMSPEAISTILRNTVMSPTLATVEKLAQGLKTTPGWLAFGIADSSVDGLAAEPDRRAMRHVVDEPNGVIAIRQPQNIDWQRDTRSIQVPIGAFHQLVSGALQNESILEEQADAYADAVLESLIARATESVVLRLGEEHHSVPGSPGQASADRS